MYEVFNAVRREIANQYTGIPIYIKNTGGKFKRPSFFVGFAGDNTTDLSKLTYKSTVLIQVVFFAELDFYKNIDKSKQLEEYEKLKNIFQKKGYLQVGDRCPTINSLDGGPRDNEIYLTIDLDWYDSRYTPETGDTADTLELDFE
ncbi:hypothetical protein Ccar_16530 [Clostridium carboxidivorans P7]|uniref:phage tail terminator family protein n=1 Tax=Clostridium carboxidivorans TaxID=217159 RepID=UPI00064F3C42|nr:hypothetical protein [Clostridium carboxidivorans]AKN32380.1 hypothetical protein Ccar_16530 [Clostridium carboxidivorans P7]